MGEIKKPTAFLLTGIAILGRLLPHPPNFTPLTGASLFGASKLGKLWGYALPLAALMVTDTLLGFHATMPYVYGSFIVIIALGQLTLQQKPSFGRVATVSAISSVIFFAITNFGVWQAGGLYPHTASGLIDSYVMALPFFRNTLLGDLVFSTGFFALYQWAEERTIIHVVDQKVISWLDK